MRSLERAHAIAQISDDQRELAQQPRRLGDWLTVKELTVWLRFPSEDACRTWLRRQRIANVRRGRVILVSRRDVDGRLRSIG